MCGIVGQLGLWPGDTTAWLDAAVASLAHRGPDDAGTWSDPTHDVHLGHRRLAVVDLSAGGHQPFVSDDGRYVLVFNGEVYNHRALRAELASAGYRFRSTSDTEVLMAGISRWGLHDTLVRVNGMFALGLWDRERAELCLARDRIGEKPLFVQERGSSLRFASELKALRAGGTPAPDIDRSSLALFLRLGYVPAPWSIHTDVSKVQPGTIRRIRHGTSETETYWSAPQSSSGPGRSGTGSGPARRGGVAAGRAERDDVDELAELLGDAVGLRMEADVAVGAFLSGGIDSSLVTSLMVAHGARVRTFTIGFEQERLDEAHHAARIASHLGTEHTELRVSPADALAIVPMLPTMFDEPFADSSAIPTALLAGLTRRHVTVALSGDGGDELFGGYDRYRRLARGAPLTVVPRVAARALARTARRAGTAFPALAGRARTLERIGVGIAAGGTRGLYESLVSLWEDPAEAMASGVVEHPYVLNTTGSWPLRGGLVRHAMAADLVSYLPDDILVKVDRTTMAYGLEARVPLLDPRVVDWASRAADPSIIGRGVTKAPLRSVLARHVPVELFERPKMGFGAPVGEWLRGPLRGWADELLDPAALASGDLLDPVPIRRRWAAHLSGAVDGSFPLWAVLSFQAWRRQWER